MAIRTTAEQVSAIVEVDTSISLTPFIEVASALVDEVCATVEAGYADARLELIERWLSAHFICIRDPQASSEKAGSVGQSLQNKVDLHFNQTRYGQMALLLDTSGTLAALQAQAEGKGVLTASLTSLGPVSDEDADIDR